MSHEESRQLGHDLIRDYYDEGTKGLNTRSIERFLTENYGQGRNAVETGLARGGSVAQANFGQGTDAMNLGRADLMGAYGQGQGALGAGLAGGLGMLGAGAGAAQGLLAGQIGQDMAARSAYADRLMGGLAGGDDPYWNRLGAQRQDQNEAALAKQGLSGSSAAAAAITGANAQLQDAREQQFYQRAQGLFNAGAAQQAAGLAQGAGLAGAGLYGDMGRAGAGLYGQQGDALGRFGAAAAGRYDEHGRYLGNMNARAGEVLGGMWTSQGDHLADADQRMRIAQSGLAGQAMGPTSGVTGIQPGPSPLWGLIPSFNVNTNTGGGG